MSKLYPAALAALVVSVAALTVGCKKPGVEGKWQGQLQGMSSTIEFKPSGEFTQSSQIPIGTVEGTGTYKVAGENISLTVTDAKVGGRSVLAMLPPAQKQQSGTWKREGDSLTLTMGKSSASLTAVKP